jgi:hypothetical protein
MGGSSFEVMVAGTSNTKCRVQFKYFSRNVPEKQVSPREFPDGVRQGNFL